MIKLRLPLPARAPNTKGVRMAGFAGAWRHALIGIGALGLATFVACGGGGGAGDSNSGAVPPSAPAQETSIVVTAGPRSKTWAGETYASRISAVASSGEAIEYRLGTQAPPELTLDATTGLISWAVPAGANPGKWTFDISIHAVVSGAKVTQPVTVEVLAPNVLIDSPVTNEGGTVADSTGAYQVTIPPDSLQTAGVDGRVSVQVTFDSDGQRVIGTRYGGFKAGTKIVENFSEASAATAQSGARGRTALSGKTTEIIDFKGRRGELYEPYRKSKFPLPDVQLLTNFYAPAGFPITRTLSEEDAAAGEVYEVRTAANVAEFARHTAGGVSTKPIAIFVHGFRATTTANECPFGGGMADDETWGEPNALVDKFADKYEVYEFRWRTCQPFEAAAAALGFAIEKLFTQTLTDNQATDKKVTIFAHSFGGVLVSTLLQKRFAPQFAPPIKPLERMQAVYFFDSPLSGIVRTADPKVLFPPPGDLPNGRVEDDWSIGNCRQITCFQMGFGDDAQLNSVVAAYFSGVLHPSPGSFAKALVSGWTDFSPPSAAFAINAVLTDYPKRLGGRVVESLQPGDGLIDSRGAALDIRHFKHNGETLPLGAIGPSIKSLDGLKDLHYLQRYYASPETGKSFAMPWVTQYPLKPGDTSSVKVFRVDSARYPADKKIPDYVNYYFTTRPWAHTSLIFAGKVVLPGNDGVVKYDTSGSHLLEFFIAKAAAEAASVELAGPLPPPEIVTPLRPLTGFVGSTVTFSVVATSGGRLSYRWFRNNVPVLGASDSSTYTTPTLTAADDGSMYSVVVSNLNSPGSRTSGPVRLTVSTPTALSPDLAIEGLGFAPSSVAPGAPVQVSFVVRNAGTATAAPSTAVISVNQSDSSDAGVNRLSLPIGTLVPGATQSVVQSVAAPSTPGAYRVWAVADSEATAGQEPGARADDRKLAPGTLTVALAPTAVIDLVPSGLTFAPSTVTAGTSLTVLLSSLTNEGNTSSNPAVGVVRVNQSTTSPVGTDIGTMTLPAVPAGSSATSLTASIGAPATPGTYRVWLVVDPAGTSGQTAGTTQNDAVVAGGTLTVVAPGSPMVSGVTFSPTNLSVGATVVFSVAGTNLTSGMRLVFPGCSALESGVGTATLRRFACTLTQAGYLMQGFVQTSTGTSIFSFSASVAQVLASFSDTFDGPTMNSALWSGGGTPTFSGGVVTISSLAEATTRGKVLVTGGTVSVEARMAGVGTTNEVLIYLTDVATNDIILFGNSSYASYGMYLISSGLYLLPEFKNGTPATTFKEYRLIISGSALVLERGDTAGSYTERFTATLPTSVAGRRFYVTISGRFDRIAVQTTP